MNASVAGRPPAWLSIVGVVALLWNLIGVCFYLGQIGVLGSPFVQAGAPVMPLWISAAYAIGTFGGALGSLGLALHRVWAKPVLLLSLIALIIDWGWVFMMTGSAAAPLGAFVLVIAVLLLWLAHSASRRGWLS